MREFEWTDERAKEFARIASAGPYGAYKGCKSLNSKLERYKILNTLDLVCRLEIHSNEVRIRVQEKANPEKYLEDVVMFNQMDGTPWDIILNVIQEMKLKFAK